VIAVRFPAITPAARAQRRADVLARCISVARTPQEAARFRRGYQLEAARAAAGTRTDVPTGTREVLFALARRYRFLLLILAVGIPVELVLLSMAPAWLVNDLRWLGLGYLAGVFVQWLKGRRAAREDQDVYDCPGCGECRE
jgi:hypothetical protein